MYHVLVPIVNHDKAVIHWSLLEMHKHASRLVKPAFDEITQEKAM